MCPPQSSLAELQEMTRCLRHYCSVFSSMEEQLCEEQAESYRLLSEQDRWVGGPQVCSALLHHRNKTTF